MIGSSERQINTESERERERENLAGTSKVSKKGERLKVLSAPTNII